MSNEKPFFVTPNRGFAAIDESADLLHPQENARVQTDSATETQYFGFSIPEERIHAVTYLWHHPKLRLVSGGLFVWQGIKPVVQYSELFDWRVYMSDSVLKDDLWDYRFENGYGVKIIEPLKKFHLTYADPTRKNSVDLISEALLPPVMFADGNHFEQAMKVNGELVLRGKRYEIDCYNVRDRSWGKGRPEENMPFPPVSWMSGVFNETFAFNCCAFDQASNNPELKGRFEIPDEGSLIGGWVHRDGKLGRIVSIKKRVERAKNTFLPMKITLNAVDDLDRKLDLQGTLIACAGAFPVWPNAYQHHPLMRWECGGMVGYGDCMEPIWNDYINFMTTK